MQGVCVKKDKKEHLTFVPKIITEVETLKWLAEMSNGDARIALNSLQLAIQAVNAQSEHHHQETERGRA